MRINNRRYIGSKTRLLNNIDDIVKKYKKDYDFVFGDLFGGTGIVSEFFFEKGSSIIINDNLYSNYVAYMAWLSNGDYNAEKIDRYLKFFNKINPSELTDNYFSRTFKEKYYSENDAKKIGFIRELIEKDKDKLSEREYYILLASLLYEADKIANTCGHFESYLKKKPKETGVELKTLEIFNSSNNKNKIYCMDANELAKKIKADIVYIDPPYNARQYVNFYHVLENLARWERPSDLEGDSMKFKRNHLKSEYSKSHAKDVFEELIKSVDSDLIIVSYSNTYNAKSGASNNKISEEELNNILLKKGTVSRYEVDYKAFNAGKTELNNHKEYLYVCEVR